MTSTHCEPVYINSHTMDGSELQSLEHAQRQRLLSDSEQEAPRSTSYLSSSDAVDHSAEPPNHPGSLNFDFEPTALNSLSASLKTTGNRASSKGSSESTAPVIPKDQAIKTRRTLREELLEWRTEIISCTFSAVVLVALAITISVYQGKPVPQNPIITINALLAIYTLLLSRR